MVRMYLQVPTFVVVFFGFNALILYTLNDCIDEYTQMVHHSVGFSIESGAPWLKRVDRLSNSPELLARVTPQQRALLGEFETSVGPYHSTIAPDGGGASTGTFTYHPPSQVKLTARAFARLQLDWITRGITVALAKGNQL